MEFNQDVISNNILASHGPIVQKTCNDLIDKLLNVNQPVLNEEIITTCLPIQQEIYGGADLKNINFIENNDNYFNVDIFGYEVSIWFIILILGIILSICYFIYNYIICCSNVVSIKKNKILKKKNESDDESDSEANSKSSIPESSNSLASSNSSKSKE
jgi:hypothetical protein